MIDAVLGILAPHSCSGCGQIGTLLCHSCKYDIVSEPYEQCIVCEQPSLYDNLCYSCKIKTPYTNVWCVGVRKGVVKEILDRYKFSSAKQAGTVLADLLDARLPLLPDTLTVVPVPTSPAHQRSRGFDHTLVIAKRFARLRGLPLRRLLVRHGNTTQHFKSRKERLATATNGLSVSGTITGSILLVDDIYTTGATLQACAQKLLGSGADQVYIAVLARQTLDDSTDL